MHKAHKATLNRCGALMGGIIKWLLCELGSLLTKVGEVLFKLYFRIYTYNNNNKKSQHFSQCFGVNSVNQVIKIMV